MQTRQLYHFGIDGGQCDIALPQPTLAHCIDYYWLLTLDKAQLDLEVIPDMAIDLVMSPCMPDFAAIYLPVDYKFSIPLAGPVQYAGVCFRTSRFDSLFRDNFNIDIGIDIDVLRNLKAGPATIGALHIAELVALVQGRDSIQSVTAAFDAYWTDRASSTPAIAGAHKTRRLSQQELLSAIMQSLGDQGIRSVCATLGVSDRQFRRLSQDLLGLTPKKIQSIFRLQAALSDLLATQPSDLGDLYYDDSHRIRELKKLTGFTPTQIRNMAEKYNTR